MDTNPYLLIPKHFYDLLDDVLDCKHTHYWLKGGRGSCKSSFIGIAIPLMMMIDAQKGIYSNAVALRKVGDTLVDSVFAQLLWGIEMLGVSAYWKIKTSPLELKYLPTGQVIKFRSCNNKDDVRKHEIKLGVNMPSKGNVRMLQVTENQFENMKILCGKKVNEEKIGMDSLITFE